MTAPPGKTGDSIQLQMLLMVPQSFPRTKHQPWSSGLGCTTLLQSLFSEQTPQAPSPRYRMANLSPAAGKAAVVFRRNPVVALLGLSRRRGSCRRAPAACLFQGRVSGKAELFLLAVAEQTVAKPPDSQDCSFPLQDFPRVLQCGPRWVSPAF